MSAHNICGRAFFARMVFGLALLVSLFFASPSARAQTGTLTQTFSRVTRVDGSSLHILFDFSSRMLPLDTRLLKTTISITFSKTADLGDDPPFYSEMGFELSKLSPTSTVLAQATLVDTSSFNDGAIGSSFSGAIVFDDSAPRVVNFNPDQPLPGTYAPEQPFSALGLTYSPYWELTIDDTAFQNPLIFRTATLNLFVSVPEPSTLGLMGGLFLLGLVSFRQKRRSAV